MKKIALGRGLEALIPIESSINEDRGATVTVATDRISPNPFQPRQKFDPERLAQLADSLKRNGVMQPLIVKNNGSGFTIIAGERRLRAARLAGLAQVPVVVRNDIEDNRMLELALVENLQREDLNPMETADGYRTLMERCQLTQQELAETVGKSRAAVANVLRLLQLPESIQRLVRDGRLSEGHARSILALGNETDMLRLAHRIVDDELSVRDAEAAVTKTRKGRPAKRRRLPELAEAESVLKRILGTAVHIKPGRKKGRIEIEYYGNEDLNRLLELLQRVNG